MDTRDGRKGSAGGLRRSGRKLTRRDVLVRAGRVSLAAVAAGAWACGVDSEPASVREGGGPKTLPPLALELDIAQWPAYIDKRTVPKFESATGIDVGYKEVINDNQEFYSVLRSSLAEGRATGWDLVALSDWVVAKMRRTGYLMELDYSLLPNVESNLGQEFRDPPYDPGNRYSVPWQGGITGVAFNRKLTGRKLSAIADLWDPQFEGHVGMLSEMVDTMSLALLLLGIEPLESTVDDAEKAQRKLLEQRNTGLVRSYYGNDYIDGLARGDLWATMAWSGDIFWLRRDHPDIEFVVPQEGGMLWATPLEIPRGAKHPRDAHSFLDFVYRPEIAANITEWVGFITPVPQVRDVLVERARVAKSGNAEFLRELASSEHVFPSAEMKQKLHDYKVLSPDEEQAWNDLFSEVTQG